MPKFHNPLPESLQVSCSKAASILDHFIKGNTKLDSSLIPSKVLERAQGGLVVSRLSDGSWSAPSAICLVGAGVGAQFGASITDIVFILNNSAAVKAFAMGGNFTLGVAAGPTGRAVEASGAAIHLAPIYSYSKSKGAYVGITIEGSVITARPKANKKMYGRKVSPKELLFGDYPKPAEAEPLYRMLNNRFGHLGSAFSSEATLNTSVASLPTRATPPPIPQKRKTAVALYDFAGERDSDLSFSEGDIITITSQNGGWWTGIANGKSGEFPSNYVQI